MTRPPYPEAHQLDLVENLHGRQVADPYRWLEDSDAEQTRAWAEAEDKLFAAHRERWPGRDYLRTRLVELQAAGVVSAPVWRGERRFFMRRTSEQEHAVLLTVDAGGGERVLLDPMRLNSDGTTTLDAWQPSKEGGLLAYQTSERGTEDSVIRVMDVETGELVDGPIDRTRYSPVAWLPGGKAYYYVRRLPAAAVPPGEDQYHRRVYLHRVGTNTRDDVLIFGEGLDKTSSFGVAVSIDGRWLVVTRSVGTAPRNDLWLADLHATNAEQPNLQVVQEGVDANISLRVGRDGRAYIFTDRDAPRGRLCVASPADPSYDTWTDLLPEDLDAVLDDYAILDGPEVDRPVLLASWIRHVVSEVTAHDLATGERIGTVPLPGLGSVGGLAERPEGGHETWFGYTDNTTPPTVYRYDARTRETTLWASPPGTVEVPALNTRQVAYTSVDGTTVRMFVISREAEPSEPRPAVVYGYGGFGIPLTPGYSASVLAWVEAGGVFVITGLRGGSEEGEEWHRAGMREHKQRVFDDFHAAIEWLIDHGWTTSRQVAVNGGSNGGLLVGATLTQRPELVQAAVCAAPLLDMVRFERFGLGQMWSDEYGTADNAEELGWLLGYSPYHHVRDGIDYPAVLFTVFDGDTRVDPMHARKMCAALQHATAGERPILFRRETDVGHGARAVSRMIEMATDTIAFMAAQTGLPVGRDTQGS